MTQGSCLKLKCWVHLEKIAVFNRLLCWATGLSSLREAPGADAECLKHECCILLKDILMCYIHDHDVGFVPWPGILVRVF